MKRLLVLALALGVVLMVTVPKAHADDTADLFKSKCQMCHGADGKGTPTGTKMGAHDWHSADVQKMTDAQIEDTISKGKNKMPAYAGKLTADQIKGLAAYVKALGKK
jgi:mono/diheme cytochrome c family protein